MLSKHELFFYDDDASGLGLLCGRRECIVCALNGAAYEFSLLTPTCPLFNTRVNTHFIEVMQELGEPDLTLQEEYEYRRSLPSVLEAYPLFIPQ